MARLWAGVGKLNLSTQHAAASGLMVIKRARKQTTRDGMSEHIPAVSASDLVTRKQAMMRNGKTVSVNEQTPLFEQKAYDQPSIFTAVNLLREARRQKRLAEGSVPALCVLDPDGDLLDYLRVHNRAHVHTTWACYHTKLYTVVEDGWEWGLN